MCIVYIVQRWAIRWALGCVSSAFWLILPAGCEFTQPRIYLIAELSTTVCTTTCIPKCKIVNRRLREFGPMVVIAAPVRMWDSRNHLRKFFLFTVRPNAVKGTVSISGRHWQV